MKILAMVLAGGNGTRLHLLTVEHAKPALSFAGGDTDFGRHIIPLLPRRHRALAYDFASNTVPGVQPYEERGYWRDIGTVDAYKAAQLDVLGPLPCFSLVNAKWPIRGDAYRVRRPHAPPRAMDLAATGHIVAGASANAPLVSKKEALMKARQT